MKTGLNVKQFVFRNEYGVLNLFLLLVCTVLLIFYVVEINKLVSGEYKIKILESRLGESQELQRNLQAEKFQIDGIPQIVRYAVNSGMIEARSAIYVFEEAGLARGMSGGDRIK